jgi:hypothetical protein
MSADEISNDVDLHGTVVVIVQRGHLMMEKCTDADGGLPSQHYDAPDTKTSCKQVVKDNRVSHAVR